MSNACITCLTDCINIDISTCHDKCRNACLAPSIDDPAPPKNYTNAIILGSILGFMVLLFFIWTAKTLKPSKGQYVQVGYVVKKRF